MCLPTENESSSSSARSSFGLGALLLVACVAGPALAGARDRPTATTADPKAIVRRLIEEVLNGGRLEAIDELYTPQLARGARRWITRSARASPTSRCRSST